jgi:hypothetical protein
MVEITNPKVSSSTAVYTAATNTAGLHYLHIDGNKMKYHMHHIHSSEGSIRSCDIHVEHVYWSNCIKATEDNHNLQPAINLVQPSLPVIDNKDYREGIIVMNDSLDEQYSTETAFISDTCYTGYRRAKSPNSI